MAETPSRLFEEAWGGPRGNRRKSEALICSLEVEGRPMSVEAAPDDFSVSDGKRSEAGDLVMNTQNPASSVR